MSEFENYYAVILIHNLNQQYVSETVTWCLFIFTTVWEIVIKSILKSSKIHRYPKFINMDVDVVFILRSGVAKLSW